ncbi:DUF4179 domain-containing protein [Clostridium hydrogenum]|uniref:DUF4179 domain-containing protein n=1 Tax=Clostridium hydrogenum TaxID=2855764 RepID=UPI001F20ACAC|nr:DUF4179 domain-containing protein [Clostridium hydrogenum]
MEENKFEMDLKKVLTEEKEIPDVVKKSFNDTYNIIRSKSKTKNRRILKTAAVILCLIGSVIVINNKYVIAAVNSFFSGAKSVQTANDKSNFVHKNVSSAFNNGVNISLDNYFIDDSEMGLNFSLKINTNLLPKGKIEDFSMEYRIKNGDGQYIAEVISDTKPLKSKNFIVDSGGGKSYNFDEKNGTFQYDELLSAKNSFPKINNAVVEVETIDILYKDTSGNEKGKGINGSWNLKIDNNGNSQGIVTKYKAKNTTSNIQVISAKDDPTNFYVTFSTNKKVSMSDLLDKIKLVDKNGKKYQYDTLDDDKKDGKTIFKVKFPISMYDNIDKFKFSIDGVGEVELSREKY